MKITDIESLQEAIQTLHKTYSVPHVVITSVSLPAPDVPANHLCVVGSSMTSTGKARLFKTVFPKIDCYFSGTGDMFGALISVRMREAAIKASAEGGEEGGLMSRKSWVSDDDVAAVDLPLAHATEKVLASMHEVLSHTKEAMPAVVEGMEARMKEEERQGEKQQRVVRLRAAELQLVRHLDCLRNTQKLIQVSYM